MNRPHLLLVPALCISLFLHAEDLRESVIQTIAGSADDNIPGAEFSFGGLAGFATDTSGNIFFTIQPLHKVYRLGINGRVSPYAGNGVAGEQRDGVLATDSPLSGPASLAADSAGNLYIAVEHALLRVNAGTSVISTVFTTPYRPSGASIGISDVGRMAVGPTGLLYICDASTIKSYSPELGAVAIVAGPLKHPQSIAVGADGTLYFSTLEPAVYRVGRNGRLELISLKLPSDHRQLGDYDIPSAIALDAAGHLFVAQGNRSRVLCIDLDSRAVTIYGGTGQQGFNGDWIDARLSNITAPEYLSIDSDGNLVVGEQYRVQRIDVSDRVIATMAGNGLPGLEDSGTTGGHGKLWEPANVVPTPDGSVYITNSFSQRVSRLKPDGSLVTAAGGGDPARFADPGPALEVSLNYPEGLWIGESGEIYFSDNDNRIIRQLEGEWIDNFAITPKMTNSAGVFLYYAAALVADANYFYMSDPNADMVWRISRADGRVEAYAGIRSDTEIQSGEDSLSRGLVHPSGLALDESGNLFISDGAMNGEKGRILRVDAATRQTTLVLSHLRQPSGLAFQSANTLCFSESGGNQVRCLDLANHSVRLVAGTGVAGYWGDGGPAECARLNRPSGISFDASGQLYIADTGNQRVRVVRLGEQAAICR